MKKILVLFAHPAFQKSRINKILVDGLRKKEGIHFHDLYQMYPDLNIDVDKEQELLQEHDVIIFHHPFFWYSTPAILKEWQDLVLTHGWAYGKGGDALMGKYFFNVITTGGPKKVYSENIEVYASIRKLILPIEKTFKLCRMHFLPPFVIHGAHNIKMPEVEIYKQQYHQLLDDIHQEKLDLDQIPDGKYMNPELKTEA